MSGYEKVSFLKFEAAGESWYVTGWHVSETPGHSWADIQHQDDDTVSCRVSLDDWQVVGGGHFMRSNEKSAIVEYLRANPLPGDG